MSETTRQSACLGGAIARSPRLSSRRVVHARSGCPPRTGVGLGHMCLLLEKGFHCDGSRSMRMSARVLLGIFPSAKDVDRSTRFAQPRFVREHCVQWASQPGDIAVCYVSEEGEGLTREASERPTNHHRDASFRARRSRRVDRRLRRIAPRGRRRRGLCTRVGCDRRRRLGKTDSTSTSACTYHPRRRAQLQSLVLLPRRRVRVAP